MNDSPYVLRPEDVVWVLWSGDHEAAAWQLPSRVAQQFLQSCLAISRIGAHVAQITAEPVVGLADAIAIGIKGAIQRNSAARAEFLRQFAEHRAAGEAEINVKSFKLLTGQIFRVPAAKFGNGDGRVNVIEHFHRSMGAENCVDRFARVGEIGADHCNLSVVELAAK